MNHDQWLERAEMYALGALDVEEATQFEAHLASRCGLCEDHLRETREALTLVPRSLTPVNPPPAVKARLLSQIAGEAAPVIPVRPRPRWLWWGMSAGAFAAAGLLITLSWTLVTTRQEVQTLEGRVAGLQAELSKREAPLALYTAVINLLRDPSTRDVALRGVGPGAGAAGRFLWNKSGEGHIFVANLSPATEGKAYVVWTIAPGKPPRSAGVIQTDASGSGGLHIYPGRSDHPVQVFAVTLEPSGDVSAPTGPTVLVSHKVTALLPRSPLPKSGRPGSTRPTEKAPAFARLPRIPRANQYGGEFSLSGTTGIRGASRINRRGL